MCLVLYSLQNTLTIFRLLFAAEKLLTKEEAPQALRGYVIFPNVFQTARKPGFESRNSEATTYAFPPHCNLHYKIILKTIESISSIFSFMIVTESTVHRVSPEAVSRFSGAS